MVLSGLIAASATPLRAGGFEIDYDRMVRHCRHLLALGNDGVNLLGTTGEATSFSADQRMAAMSAVASSGLPVDRFMVGTGSSALAEAAALTRHAVDLGFGGQLVLPPFYYRGIGAEEVQYFYEELIPAVDRPGQLRIYLYQIPQNTGISFPVEVIARLRDQFPDTVVGLKDSSGDLEGAAAMARALPGFAVFPSSEAAIPQVGEGGFAGVVSATLNVTAPFAGRGQVPEAVAVRQALSSLPLVAAIRWALADLTGDKAWLASIPPLARLSDARQEELQKKLATTAYRHLREAFEASLSR